MQKIKVIYMGTPDFALLPLKALIEHPLFDVEAVVTQPDKKIGRKQIVSKSPVKTMALEHDLPILQPKSVNNPEFTTLMRGLKPDFIVIVAFGQILSREVLDIPKYDCINIHASLLPLYRGASPIHEALLHGDKETGVSIMRLVEKLDEGEIYYMKRMKIEEKDDIVTLSLKQSILGATMLPFTLIDIVDNGTRPIRQGHKNISYCKKIKKEDGLIKWNGNAEEILNKIRAFKVWPNCFTFIGNKQFKILEAGISKGKAKQGEVIFLSKDSIGIGTSKGLLIPRIVQLEGKKITSIEDFLKGYTETLRIKKSFTSNR